jgi:hypothetical protein
VNKPARWSVALGSGLLLSLTALTPVTTATAAPANRVDLVDVPAVDLVGRAVVPTPCPEQPLQDFVNNLVANMTNEEFTFLVQHQGTLLNVPTYEPLIFGTDTDPTYALTLHSTQLEKTFRQVKNFWTGIKSDDIQLMAMHSDMLLDASRIARTLAFLADSPVTPAMQTEANTVAAFMQTHGDFVNNPLWTLNAYAFSGQGDPDPRVAAIPDKLVFGDGFIEAMEAFGLGDVGPRVVMGHEFGHHIQYELGLFNSPLTGAEATRRTELMADSFAGYFGAHKKGLTLNAKRIVDAIETFYDSGDCQFTDPGHHGTPIQRQRAATWGADLAMASKPASSKLLASEVDDLFEVQLPIIVAP